MIRSEENTEFVNDMKLYMNQFGNDLHNDSDSCNNKYIYVFSDINRVIWDYLDNADDKFIDKLREKMSTSSYNLESYFFNLYIIACSYLVCRDNPNHFDNYCNLVDDVAKISIPVLHKSFFPWKEYCFGGINIVSYLINESNYKDSDLRKFFMSFLSNLNNLDRVKEHINVFNSFINKEESRDIFSYFIYPKVLSHDDRYKYVCDKLFDVEKNHLIRQEVMSRLDSLSPSLFDELNEDSDIDIFIWCMDILFDSDSYQEFHTKLLDLEEASKNYRNGYKENSLNLVKSLTKDAHKTYYNNSVVAYKGLFMNRFFKPRTIIGRMKDLYSKNDNSISYEFMDEEHRNATSIHDLKRRISKCIFELNDKKSFLGKVKEKLRS